MPDKNNKTLKPGWRWVKFGDVVRQCKEKADPETSGLERYIAGDHMDTDDLRLRRWGEIGSGYLGPAFHMRFKPGQVLYGSRRTYLRKVAVADFDGICANTTFVLEPKSPEELLPAFLPFLMQTDAFNDFSVMNSKGSVNPYINFSDLAQFEFALPPMDEQRQIVPVLLATRECAEAYQSAEGALQTFLLSRTDELFSGPVDVEAKTQVIGDIAEVQYGLTINANRRIIEKQLPYLRVANVQRFHMDLSEVKDVGVDSKDDGCVLRRNDILVVEGHADIAELGRASIWEDQLPICLHQNHLIRIRCRPEFDPYYVLEYVNSPAGRAYFRGRGKSTSGLNTLNSTVVRVMPIPIPPLATQKSIADELKEARRSLKEIADRKEQHATVSKRLSAEIFGGGQG